VPTLFRPPYGDINADVRAVTRAMGYRAVMWNVDTLDWQLAQTNLTKMLTDFEANLTPLSPNGIIHLQHDLLIESVNSVPKVVDIIKKKLPKYRFVSLDECVWGAGFKRNPSWAHMHRGCNSLVAGWPTRTILNPCPVSDWSDWSMCDSNCGAGRRTRVRLTLPPGLEKTVWACRFTPLIEMSTCTGAVATCDTSSTCKFTPWTAFGSCSRTGGGGTRLKTRQLISGSTTNCGPFVMTELCNLRACV
jgi:hypothetical protein